MFRFLTFPPFCYVKIRKKKDDFDSIVTAWFYFVFAKKFDIPVRKYVYFMYQVSSMSKLLTLISFRTDNFGGKIGSLSFTSFSYCLCSLSSQYNDILQRTNEGQLYKLSGI